MRYLILFFLFTGCVSFKKGDGCRIGMTTQLEKRLKSWKKKYSKEGVKILNHRVLKVFDTRTEAQSFETSEKKKQGCEAHQGGRNPQDEEAKWSVYILNLRKV